MLSYLISSQSFQVIMVIRLVWYYLIYFCKRIYIII